MANAIELCTPSADKLEKRNNKQMMASLPSLCFKWRNICSTFCNLNRTIQHQKLFLEFSLELLKEISGTLTHLYLPFYNAIMFSIRVFELVSCGAELARLQLLKLLAINGVASAIFTAKFTIQPEKHPWVVLLGSATVSAISFMEDYSSGVIIVVLDAIYFWFDTAPRMEDQVYVGLQYLGTRRCKMQGFIE